MRLGIDFGTTRILAAAVDRGNYPVISFETPSGEALDWFPPLVALSSEALEFGWHAWSRQGEEGWAIVRSLKRTLEDAGPGTVLQVDEHRVSLFDVLVSMIREFRRQLLENGTPRPQPGEPLEVMLGVPANAHSNQRFLTVEAFRRAGFEVLGLLNEPSAASIEFGHRKRESSGEQPKLSLLVYDLGGGTFDVSLVELAERTHTVIASEVIPTLGGDDFDTVLADLALDTAQIPTPERDSMRASENFALLEECRVRKEALHPNTRRIVVDLDQAREGWGSVSIPVADYYERCRPLVDETIHAMADLLAAQGYAQPGADLANANVDNIYVTGGSSDLPIVARMLREQFAKRMVRSPHSRAATAIGLAIQADASAGYVLRERFTRFFGVWREAEHGRRVIFDPLFEKNTQLPAPGEPSLSIRREYWAVHNVGHFRYMECSHRSPLGEPSGDLTVWDEILFPVDPALRDQSDLAETPVARRHDSQGQWIEEIYTCDASGTVTVVIRNRTSGYDRQYRLGRWAAKDAPVTPGRKKRAKKS
jgi:molecular chaperone DnaK (HSP70)